MTTDPIAAARAVLENDLSIMLLCETCPDECNCHPPADMWRRRESGKLICEGCADDAAMPVEDLHHAPRPDHIIRALLVALELVRRSVLPGIFDGIGGMIILVALWSVIMAVGAHLIMGAMARTNRLLLRRQTAEITATA